MATELPCEPIEEPEEPIAFSERVFGVDMVIAHEDAPYWPNLLLNGEGSTGDSTSFPPTTPTIYVPEWGIT